MATPRTARAARWLWLPPAAAAVVGWPVWRAAYDAEEGSRAGAEPTMAGIFAVTPLVLLALVQISLAAIARPESRSSVRACLVGATVAGVLMVALCVVVVTLNHWSGYPWTEQLGVLLVAAVVAASLVPAWLTHARR